MLYGPISETSWWGDEITPIQFADDLKSLGDVLEINVRINSSGGDVFAAQAINSLLRAHKAKINVFVDGIAASAATIVAMAGDTISIPSSGLMMIHNPLVSLWGSYNKQDFESMTEVLETVKDAIINSYIAKTGKDKEELSKLMDAETWLTGIEAVEQGFADTLTDSVVNSFVNGNTMIVNNLQFDTSKFINMPKFASDGQMPTMPNMGGSFAHQNKTKGSEEVVTLETIKNNHPEIYNQIFNLGVVEGTNAERQRFKNIEDLAIKGFDNLVEEAKFTNAITADALAVKILMASKNAGAEHMKNVKDDASCITNIGASADITNTADAERESFIDRVVNKANSIRGGKR